MCMIAYRPAGKAGHMTRSIVDTATQRHPDGFGIAWRAPDGLHVERFAPTKKSRASFKRLTAEVDKAGYEYVAHFRWATHGPKDAAHAHPYEYNDPDPKVGKVLVFHNGVIDIATTPQESDTEVFVRDVLGRLESRWWTNPALVYLVNEAIGWSKFTIMTGGETVNLHAGKGEWDDGVWYSSNHRPTQKWTPTKGGTVTKPATITGTTYTGKSYSDYDPQYHVYMAKGELTQGWWDDKNKTWVERKAPAGMKMGDRGPAPKVLLEGGASGTPSGEPARKSAKESAVALGLIAPSAGDLALLPESGKGDSACLLPENPQRWKNAGHIVSAVRRIDILGYDEEYIMAVVCDTCRTMGDAWVIDGDVYIDMDHLDMPDEEDGA